jgi:hypothetical protein
MAACLVLGMKIHWDLSRVLGTERCSELPSVLLRAPTKVQLMAPSKVTDLD